MGGRDSPPALMTPGPAPPPVSGINGWVGVGGYLSSAHIGMKEILKLAN